MPLRKKVQKYQAIYHALSGLEIICGSFFRGSRYAFSVGHPKTLPNYPLR